ncbi:flagellar biosynthesis protein FliQ [Dethiobacter alkaliphilus]|uniref:Flagellar biosynthetic protein FliQ n=1 Tax=Dethiobacter alkaliphilus AHT 1 TaxID=555088 RepID=C0GJG5_DETAL|nr:flagellar biosynthesis protein FliQ [Dethiobacter alkaliphilus]EEG76512.1 flagellar biosynthetic protein FliQ [Dethiobacter alkaliphilus AHT 1]
MSHEFVLSVARDAILTTLFIAAPVLIISLLVGLGISVFQATTQIQEQTLTFVPKIIAVFLALLVFGSWMLNTLVQFTANLFAQLGTFGL